MNKFKVIHEGKEFTITAIVTNAAKAVEHTHQLY